MGFAPYGRLTFFACAKKVSKETHPYIRPRLRRGSLAPSPLQGPATKGHPWPIAALATSMSLNPFHGDSTRPPEGDLGVVCEIVLQEQKPNATDFDLPEILQARDPVPFRRPSGGVAWGSEPHGCGEIPMAAPLKGPGMALVSRPPERRRSEGSFAQRNPDVGVPFFGTPFLGKQERCGARKGRNPNAQWTR